MNIQAWLGIAAVILGAIPAFVHLLDMRFEARLATVAVLSLLGVLAVAVVKPATPKEPVGYQPPAPQLSKWRVFWKRIGRYWQIPLLAGMTALTLVLFWTTLWYHNVRITEPAMVGEPRAEVMPPHIELALLEIQFKDGCDCRPAEVASRRRADIEMMYTGGRNSGLRVTNFAYPQAFVLQCARLPRNCISGSKTTPSTAEIIWPGELQRYTVDSIIVGGVLWFLASCFASWRVWRSGS